MSYNGYYHNPNKRFKRDFILGLIVLPLIDNNLKKTHDDLESNEDFYKEVATV